MRILFFIVFIFSFSFSVIAQNKDTDLDYYNLEVVRIQVNELYNFPVYDLIENNTITKLKKKLNSELNTVAKVAIHYKYSKALKLSEAENKELIRRIQKIAEKFIEQEKYVLFELTGGYSPVFGIKEEIINNKLVSIVMLGGDCTISDADEREEQILSAFNDIIQQTLEK